MMMMVMVVRMMMVMMKLHYDRGRVPTMVT
jgi:hypothetical protein